jgi:hypothetical protein
MSPRARRSRFASTLRQLVQTDRLKPRRFSRNRRPGELMESPWSKAAMQTARAFPRCWTARLPPRFFSRLRQTGHICTAARLDRRTPAMFSRFCASGPTPCIGMSAEVEEVLSRNRPGTADRGSDQSPMPYISNRTRGNKMKNDAFTRKTNRLHCGLLNWKPLAASSKHYGEQAGSNAFVSLPAWPGYRDAGTSTPLDCKAACQRLSVSDDTDPPRQIS